MPKSVAKRSNFGELEKKSNMRFDYAWIPEYPLPDFSKANLGSSQEVVLLNKSTNKIERISFKISHNMYFPLTKQRHVYGMIDTDDGHYVQIEFSLSFEADIYDDDYNRIVAYLRTPPVYHYSPGF